jgi:SRSO17 transposase
MRREPSIYWLCGEDHHQKGVFAAYVSRHGHAFIDRALYLPTTSTDDPVRMAAAVPAPAHPA